MIFSWSSHVITYKIFWPYIIYVVFSNFPYFIIINLTNQLFAYSIAIQVLFVGFVIESIGHIIEAMLGIAISSVLINPGFNEVSGWYIAQNSEDKSSPHLKMRI